MIAPPRVFLALAHHPVYDRHGLIITSAVSNLDIHDIARTARTYGLGAYYVCTPVDAQRLHVAHVREHWARCSDLAATRRNEALDLIEVVPHLEDAAASVQRACGVRPFMVATGAARRSGSLTVVEVQRRAERAGALLICFGTGWGLAEEVFAAVDGVLEPIETASGYNHLPVRAAVAIVLDRLFAGGEAAVSPGNKEIP